MFAGRFYPSRFYNGRYFVKVGSGQKVFAMSDIIYSKGVITATAFGRVIKSKGSNTVVN